MNLGYIPFEISGVNNTDTAPLVAVNPVSEYEDGKPTGKHVGMAYDILLPDQQLERLRVKIASDSSSPVEQVDLNNANSMGNCYIVRFHNLEVKPYPGNNGRIAYTARAESIEVAGKLSDIWKEGANL